MTSFRSHIKSNNQSVLCKKVIYIIAIGLRLGNKNIILNQLSLSPMNTYQIKNVNYNIPRCFPLLRCLCRLRALTSSLFFVVPSFIPVLNIYLSYAIEEQHATIASITAATANEQISRHKWLLSVDFVLSLIFLIHTAIFKCKAQLDMDKENLHRTHAVNWVVLVMVESVSYV